MKCDRCGEQLFIIDGIERLGETLCLDCAIRGSDPWFEQSFNNPENADFDNRLKLTTSSNMMGCAK